MVAGCGDLSKGIGTTAGRLTPYTGGRGADLGAPMCKEGGPDQVGDGDVSQELTETGCSVRRGIVHPVIPPPDKKSPQLRQVVLDLAERARHLAQALHILEECLEPVMRTELQNDNVKGEVAPRAPLVPAAEELDGIANYLQDLTRRVKSITRRLEI